MEQKNLGAFPALKKIYKSILYMKNSSGIILSNS